MLHSALAALLLSGSLFPAAAAPRPPALGDARGSGAPQAPTVTFRSAGRIEATLESGLRVALLERREVPLVVATAVVRAGAALETDDLAGASHFLEHLLFNGTSAMSQEELYDAVERMGGYNNASTAEDHTVFTLLVPSDRAREGLAVQAAMLFDSTLPEENFEKERRIVLEEIARDRSRPDQGLDAALRAGLWAGSAYGKPVLGTEATLGAMTLPRLRDYYRRHYVPGNVLLLVAGDFEAESMLDLVREAYATAPSGPPPSFPDPFVEGQGSVTRVRQDGPPAAALALPAPGPCEPLGPSAEVLAEILGSASGPLRRVLGSDRAPSIEVAYLPRPRGSALVIDARLAEGEDPEAALADVVTALERARRSGLDPTEAALAARAHRSRLLLAGQRLHYLGMLRADALAGCTGSAAPLLVDDVPAAASILAVADEVLSECRSRGRGVVVGPDVASGRAAIRGPSDPEARDAARADDRGGGATGAVPGTDVDRTLSGGLRILVAHEPGSEVAGFHVLVRDRSAREPAGRDGLADLVHRLLPQGTRLSSASALSARLDHLGAELSVADDERIPWDDSYTDPSHSFLRMEAPADSWLAALDLLAEIVRLPALRPEDVASLGVERAARARKLATAPAEVAAAAYRRALLGEGHPWARSVSGAAASLDDVSLDEVEAFAASYLAPSALIVSVVAPAPAEEVAAAVAQRFDAGGSAPAHPAVPPPPLTGEPGPPVVVALGAAQARLEMGRIAPLRPEDRAAFRLLAILLSDRLARVLREEKGLAYSLGAASAVFPDRGWLTVGVGTRADNLEAAREGVRGEMTRLREAGAGASEIDRVRAAARGRALMRRLSAVNRARALGLRAFRGISDEADADALEAMDRVAPADLERLARAWLDPDRFVTVIVR